ncbi:MAG TPA: ABC-2 family transporter protein, partial [Kofleriaceae bacterium]
MPTLLRIGVAETVAYRAEFLVWILTTTQPLIMLGLWTFVARTGSFGGYNGNDFTAYFLADLIVRQLTGNWVAWQLMEDIRLGTMSMRLLRPIHPFFAYAASHIAAIPFRAVVMLPLAFALLASSGA